MMDDGGPKKSTGNQPGEVDDIRRVGILSMYPMTTPTDRPAMMTPAQARAVERRAAKRIAAEDARRDAIADIRATYRAAMADSRNFGAPGTFPVRGVTLDLVES
jgi:hypothetical protein